MMDPGLHPLLSGENVCDSHDMLHFKLDAIASTIGQLNSKENGEFPGQRESVIPAEAGIHLFSETFRWTPFFNGVTIYRK
jgi:hypothetical protein